MTSRTRVLAVTVVFALSGGIAGASAFAAERCVGERAGCFASLQSALDAASDGDTIRLASGTFAGGVTVTKSVALVGAGQHATVLEGGGPVLTIGTLFDQSPPTVSVRDITITGGRTTSSPQSVEFFGREGVFALGGGIEIPPGENLTPGATVTITRTRVADNRVAPVATVPSGLPCSDACPFALAAGGGIDNWGTLTVTDSIIRGNRVGTVSGLSALASDAEGGGMHSRIGSLTIIRTRIADNWATATAPNGRFADGGGMFVIDGPFTMRDSSVTGNSAQLAAAFAGGVDLLAVAGGVHLGGTVPTGKITSSLIAGNSVRMTNTVGDVLTFSGGLHVDFPVEFTIADSLIFGNHVRAATVGSSRSLAHAEAGGGQLFGQMRRTRVDGNTVTATSAGDAEAMAGGLWVLFGAVSDSELLGNQLLAASRYGSATAQGGAAVVDTAPETPQHGGLTLTESSVSRNIATASGASSLAQGGGIFDAVLPNGPFGGPLTVVHSSVVHNVLSGRPGATLQGGGVFLADAPLTLTNSLIARNLPDQCYGCNSSASLTAAPARAVSGIRVRTQHSPLLAVSRASQAGRTAHSKESALRVGPHESRAILSPARGTPPG